MAKTDTEEPLLNSESKATKDVEFKVEDLSERQEKESKKTFIVAVFLLLVFWAVGAVYGIKRKGWTTLDSIYFLVATITTVGYGDRSFTSDASPATDFDFIFGGCYVFVGVVFIGALAGIILNYLSEMATVKMSQDMVAAAGGDKKFVLKDEMLKVWKQCFWTFLQIFIAVALGACGICHLEGWEWSKGFYWACVTMTTVGYGDVAIDNDASIAFSTVYILIAFGILASSLSFIGGIPFELNRLRDQDKVLNQFGEDIDETELKSLLESQELVDLREGSNVPRGAGVSRAEFALWMLMKMDKLDMDADIAIIYSVFDKLDANKSGVVDMADIDSFIQRRKAPAVIQDVQGTFTWLLSWVGLG